MATGGGEWKQRSRFSYRLPSGASHREGAERALHRLVEGQRIRPAVEAPQQERAEVQADKQPARTRAQVGDD